MVFAFTIARPDAEAVIAATIEGVDISWPISTEAQAFKLAKRIGAFGFWRLKERKPAP